MRLVFMGTPEFSVPALEALYQAGHEIIAVYTQPPRPAGRGHKVQKSPIHVFAENLDIPIYTPKKFQEGEIQELQSHRAEVAVVVAYGLILPRAALDCFPYGSLNIHASLLPRWRGAAPIQRCIEAGDQKSGITIMQMEEGLDSGPMLLKEEIPLNPEITGGELHDILSTMGASLIVNALQQLENGKINPILQDDTQVTYAYKLSPKEGKIPWLKSAKEIEQRIRAFTPWPGNWCLLEGERIKILEAHIIKEKFINDSSSKGQPGQIISTKPFIVACGKGFLEINKVQKPGKKPMAVEDFMNGFPISIGTILR